MTTPIVLGQRALNRTLLGRQHLLSRTSMPAADLVEYLVGMQAQAPLASYVGMWARLDGFDPEELSGLMASRQLVRTWLMRGTIHLATAEDCLGLAPVVRPVLTQGFNGHFSRGLDGVDVDAVVAAGTELLSEAPRTRTDLRELLGTRWPHWDADTLAFAVSYLVPVVQVTPRGLWGQNGPAAITTVESWLSRPVGAGTPIDELVRRYLTAFGPASVQDAQTWSGLTRLREVFDRLELRRYTDTDGTELYDVPDGVLVDPDTPAPVRFLPEYDNVLLSHADRRRVIPDGRRVPLPAGNGARAGTVLIDGGYAADYRIRTTRTEATMLVETHAPATADVEPEARELLAFTSPGLTPSVEIRAAGGASR